jgi:hypothetical protein
MPFGSALLIFALLAASGCADAYGFFYASKIWQQGHLSPGDLGRSALGWFVGISLYVVALRPMSNAGVTSAELQTAVWFAMTIIGVVVFSGRFFAWQRLDQAVAVGVVVALGWLLVRTQA